MIRSMTGFGSSRVEGGSHSVAVEIKTVNHRYLDLHVRLAPEFQSLEPAIRKVVSSRLGRGRVDVFVKIDRAVTPVRIEADSDLIAAYVDLIRDLQSRFPIAGELTVDAVSRLPGALQVSGADPTREESDALNVNLEDAVGEALKQVGAMRAREGEALVEDLRGRMETIRENLAVIRDGATGLLDHYRDLLRQRVGELAPDLGLDSGRLEVEALMYAEKSDIAEEVTRLESHLNQFGEVLVKGEEAGKRLDFLLQEMNREVSTILAKTAGLNQKGGAIGEAGINVKVEIDKLREQVQNIE